MCQICMTNAGTTQDNFILPAPPIGGLPISQDWLERMKLVYDNKRKNGRKLQILTNQLLVCLDQRLTKGEYAQRSQVRIL